MELLEQKVFFVNGFAIFSSMFLWKHKKTPLIELTPNVGFF